MLLPKTVPQVYIISIPANVIPANVISLSNRHKGVSTEILVRDLF
jgi:hypothetical protein